MSIDESLITATASVIFFGLTFKYFASSISNMVNNHIKAICNKFDEAEKIKVESELLLKQQQEIYSTLKAKSSEIIKAAELEVASLKNKAENDLTTQLTQQKNNLNKQLKNEEQMAFTEIRMNALKTSIQVSLKLLTSKQNKQDLFNLSHNTLDNMSHYHR